MSPTVLLLTDRPTFEAAWREPLSQAGLESRTLDPERLGSNVSEGCGVLIDAGSGVFDEDELLASVGLARALRAVPAVSLAGGDSLSGIEDVLHDLCPGLVARDERDMVRVASALSRRCDSDRGKRFEYLAVSPRPNELLAILGDGTTALLSRPLGDEDDGSEVASIALGEEADEASLTLSSGKTVTIKASAVSLAQGGRAGAAGRSNGQNGETIDGARLGARLRELRLAAGLTQAELARRTGIHRPNIARVEAGRHTPSLETLARLASAIGVPTTHVLSDD